MITSQLRLRDGFISAEHHGDPDSPVDVLFLHANGMNAASYRHIFKLLPPNIHVVAIDQRGHGATALPTSLRGRNGWGDLKDDLIAVIETLEQQPAVLSGHSMGATVSLMAMSEEKLTTHLLLFDPVWHPGGHIGGLRDAAKHRRVNFRDPDEARDWFRGRGVFGTWPEEALAGYLDTGLQSTPGGLRLSCAPAWEASNFELAENILEKHIQGVSHLTQVILAETGSAWKPQGEQKFPHLFEFQIVAGATHFLPIDVPKITAEYFKSAVQLARRELADRTNNCVNMDP